MKLLLLLPVIVVLGYFATSSSVEGIGFDEKILIIIGQNAGQPDIEIAKKIQDGLSNSGFQNVHILIDERVDDLEKNTHHLIVVGGPAINQVIRDLLPDLKLQFYERPVIVDSPEQSKVWQIINLETKREYGNIGSNNFGLGFIHNIYKDDISQHIFVISGIEAKGTKAASEYFFGQKCHNNVGEVEFIVVNTEVGTDEKGCAEIVDFEPYKMDKKIFVQNPSLLEKSNLKITSSISDKTGKITFFPNEQFEYEIKLENTASESLTYSFNEFLPSFLLLVNTSSNCQQDSSKIQCNGLINGRETVIIKYEGVISPNPDPGNWILDRTNVKFDLQNKTDWVQNRDDVVIRIQDTIIESHEFILTPESVLPGESFEAKLIVTNDGVQPFFANGTISISPSLEFIHDEEKYSVHYELGAINPKETAEKKFQLRVKENTSLWLPETQTISGTLLTANEVYVELDQKLISYPELTFRQDIVVEPSNYNFIIIISIIIIVITVILVWYFKVRKSGNRPEGEPIDRYTFDDPYED